jgi:hypothetical protein
MAMVTVAHMVGMAIQTPIALTQAAAPWAGPCKAAFVSHTGDTEIMVRVKSGQSHHAA